MTDLAFLKLRANVRMEGDAAMAAVEAARALEGPRPVRDESGVRALGGGRAMRESLRVRPPVGFSGQASAAARERILREAAFVQEVWWREGRVWKVDVPAMARAEVASGDGRAVPWDRPTPAPHVHGIHKYKARFFPRLARFLVAEHLPSRPAAGGRVLDPFSGSGTLPVEAALLGHPSMGIDIDALSCAIARVKVEILSSPTCPDPGAIEALAEGLPGGVPGRRAGYRLPPWIRAKFERRGEEREAVGHEARIDALLRHASRRGPAEATLMRLAISDAVTRKFNVRFLGTGVGRFALDVAATDLPRLARRALLQMALARRAALALGPAAPVALVRGDATRLPVGDGAVDLVVTSPPYLPASSGRENYLVGKSIALTALGLMTADEIRSLEERSMGAMGGAPRGAPGELPAEVERLVSWLAADPLRAIKAAPTHRYYLALRQALLECRRVLAPGGRAVLVIGKESVFYRFRDREVLYRVPCDAILVELARGAGLELQGRMDVELDKGHRNARPRSLDAYYESVIVLGR